MFFRFQLVISSVLIFAAVVNTCWAGMIASLGLVDYFDPSIGLDTGSSGQVIGWTNQAMPSRSVTQGSSDTSVVLNSNGTPLIRFSAPAGGGSLSYPSPGLAALAEGYTIFVVTRLGSTSAAFPRLHRSANDVHALFLRNNTGEIEVKANPLPSGMRPRRLLSEYHATDELVILTARLTQQTQDLYFNGTHVAGSQVGMESYDLDNATFQIGDSLTGDIGHVLVYDHQAGMDELNQTGSTLAQIYGLEWETIKEEEIIERPVNFVVASATPLRRIIGHRGNSSVAPENTLASILAHAGKSHMTEFDVRVTADGELILMHDATLNRTTNSAGQVGLRDYHGDIDQLDAGSWFGPAFQGEPVPTLAEAVTVALDNGLIPVIERKTGPALAYFEVLSDLGVLDQVHMIAFDWNFLADFRKLSRYTPIGALGSSTRAIDEATIQNAIAIGANYLNWTYRDLTKEDVALVHSYGLPIAVWTVNSTVHMRELMEMGVDSITTDFPSDLDELIPNFSEWAADPETNLPEGDRGLEDDPDRDGLVNGLEHFFCTNPIVSATLPFKDLVIEEDTFVFQHPRRRFVADDLSWQYEWSTDLVNWQASGHEGPGGELVTLQTTIYPDPNDIDKVRVHVSGRVFNNPGGDLFLRIRLIQALPPRF